MCVPPFVDNDTFRLDGLQGADKSATPLDRTGGTHAHPLTEVAPKVLRTAQAAVDSRGRYFQRIGAGHSVVHVEQVAQLTADAGEIVERDTALTVQVQAQDHAPGLPAELYIDHFQSFVRDQRLGDFPDPLSDRFVHLSSNKKVGTAAHLLLSGLSLMNS